MNRLFCTFSTRENLDAVLLDICTHYSILYGKIFILESKESEELLCTYNIDVHNSSSHILPSTILLHRKKETNTLYTINALNTLIKQLNNGVLDTSYTVSWQDYKNTVLLTHGSDLRLLPTRIHKIVTTG